MTGKSAKYSHLRVLVVEDQPFIRKMVVQMLLQIGFAEVQEAEHGGVGLARVSQARPDLVICDIEMEQLDGLLFLEALRMAESETKPRIPVIFLTNHADEQTVTKARDLSVDGFIVKPPTVNTLKQRIDHVLDKM